MARTRKSVLGENPFDTASETPSPATVGPKPRRATKKRDTATRASNAPKTPKTKPTKAETIKAETIKAETIKAETTKAETTKAETTKVETTKVETTNRSEVETSEFMAPEATASASTSEPSSAPPTSTSSHARSTADGIDVADNLAVKPGAADSPFSGDGEASEAERAARRRRLASDVRVLESGLEDAESSHRKGRRRTDYLRRGVSPIDMGFELPGGEDGGMFDAARELLSSDYYLRQWGRLGMRGRSEEVDDFGHDRKYDERFRPLLDVLYDRYLRVEIDGIEHLPAEGRTLIVANHAGTFPYDGIMLKTAVRREHPKAREVRWLSEDHLFYMPFVGSFLNRMGAVRACQENAERLLRHERLVAVFPEGAKGTGRLYRDRRKLQRFGRGGFVRLCLRTQTPIVPCVIVGAEESMPLLFRMEYLANLLGLPYIPVTPTFPMLGALGFVPAPTKWFFKFGQPIQFERYGPDTAEDHVLVRRLTERVRATMQGLIDQVASSRHSVWFG